jgi:hypothetical protein
MFDPVVLLLFGSTLVVVAVVLAKLRMPHDDPFYI